MRARIITITSLLVCALAIPTSAGAQPNDSGYSSVNSIAGAPDDPPQPGYSSVNSITGSSESSPPSGSGNADSGYASLNAITGPSTEAPTFVSAAPASGDQFDWDDAALGAGAALALMAFGGAALLTVRRRTAISPSASTS
jgi:hypothetical protein